MKKLILILQFSLLALCTKAQEHISFNGATFGCSRQEFAAALGLDRDGKITDHTHKNMYDRYFYEFGKLGKYTPNYYIHCSIKSHFVFECIAFFAVSNIEEEVSTFIKVFEEKYGGHIKEDTNKLGYISNGYISEYKELFALKYTIRRYSDNKPIGEIRISVAPYSINSRGGYIEITYRDYAAAKTAISEYNNIMNDIL